MKKNIFFMIMILFFHVSLFAKNIVIVATGGTIAGTAGSKTQTTGYDEASLGIQSLLDAVPEIKAIPDIQITGEQIMQIGSEDMNNESWLKLAKRVNELVKSKEVDGVVITHGTDTMEETSYFLNLVIKTKKPIVFVGSMRPATAISADGPMNLYNATLVANSDLSKDKGVLVVINDTILPARDVVKTNTFKVDAFSAPNTGALGFIQSGKVIYVSSPSKMHTDKSEFDIEKIKSLPVVDIFYGHAGANPEYIKNLDPKKVDGMIYAGSGNGSMSKVVEKASKEIRKKGIVVVRSTRVVSGIVSKELTDEEAGFLVSYELNPQKARVLLMLGLTKSKDLKYLQELFLKY